MQSDGGALAFADHFAVGKERHAARGVHAHGDGVAHTDSVHAIPIAVGSLIGAFHQIA